MSSAAAAAAPSAGLLLKCSEQFEQSSLWLFHDLHKSVEQLEGVRQSGRRNCGDVRARTAVMAPRDPYAGQDHATDGRPEKNKHWVEMVHKVCGELFQQ